MIGEMEYVSAIVILVIFGLLFGSFAGAQVWRIRARQLRDDDQRLKELRKLTQPTQDEQEELAYLIEDTSSRKSERKQLNGLIVGVSQDHSRCLACQHRLAWYDLLPLVSWLSTTGKCRYCRHSIGWFELAMELGVACAFAVSYIFWPFPLVEGLDIAVFVCWLAALVLLAILFAYDSKWFLLPDVIVFPLIIVGLGMGGIRFLTADNGLAFIMGVLGAVAALSGLYFALWLFSKGRWVGFGDVKLGLALALLLADWRLALLTLFLANFIGTLIVVPGMVSGKIGRKAHIPFGPLLIAGAFIAMLVGNTLITVYTNTLF